MPSIRRDPLWNPTTTADWREELIRILLNHGTDGVKQGLLTRTLMNYADADQIVAQLEAYEVEQKVQRFKVASKRGRPAVIWRATTRLLEEC